ncbi:MAG TPA: acylphosphatase [Bacteroidales bacterium]|nr:acylphosphatase [Bacteroidales bacterium]
MRKTISIRILGRVQGVGFRYYTKKKAIEFTISGFVQNKPDGSVYIEATGEAIDIETFADWCKQGPSWARVNDFLRNDLPLKEWNRFEIN